MARNTNNGNQHKDNYLNYLWLVGMVLYVPFVAMFLNFPIFAGRSYIIQLVWSVLLLLFYLIFPKKPVYRTVASVLFVDGLLNLIHWIILRAPVTAASVFVLLNTNFSEATEFMSLKLTPRFLLLIPYIIVFVIALKHVPPISFKTKTEKWTWSVLAIAALAFLGENIVNQRFLRKAATETTRGFVSFFQEAKSYKTLKKKTFHPVEASLPADNDSSLVVLILGESSNRSHFSLYGYERETTPRLKKRTDILTFTDVITPYGNTMTSVLHALMETNMDNNIAIDTSIHIFDVFRAAQFKTYWISNQSPVGIWDNAVFNLAQLADVGVFINNNANSSFESTLVSSYDENLFQPLTKTLATDNAPHKFIVLHLMGCHTQYSKRYPSGFKVFQTSSNLKEKTTNEYDNAVVYTDFIIDSVFNIMAKYSESHPHTQVSCLYLSDHGENVFDNGSDYAGHEYSSTIPHSILEVPFILWLSEAKIAALGEDYQHILNQLNKPYMSDDLFFFLIDLANIQSPYRVKERSLISPEYNANRIRNISDGTVYDE